MFIVLLIVGEVVDDFYGFDVDGGYFFDEVDDVGGIVVFVVLVVGVVDDV